mgnify:CR=1 FL=1
MEIVEHQIKGDGVAVGTLEANSLKCIVGNLIVVNDVSGGIINAYEAVKMAESMSLKGKK